MKSMGSNGWRTAHNIVAPEFLDACDRQGMMVMAETRMMASTPEGLSELERMVKRDRNHPSIVIWSLANEEYFYQGTPTGARIVTTMKRLVKKLDPTRVVTAAMNGGWVHGGVSDVVDVQGFNYWNGNLPDTKSNKPKGAPVTYDIDAFHREFPNKPCIGTEVSNAGSSRGIYVTDPAQGHLALYKAGMVDENVSAETVVAAYNARPFLSGSFNWTGIDYRGEPNPFDRVCISSQFGCVDTCLYPKDIFYYYKSWWGTEPVLHLFPHWNWHGKEGSTIEVRCFSNTESVELFVNGESQGAKPMPRNGHLTWSVKYAPGAIEARGSNGGKVVLTERRETTGAAAKLVLRANRAKLNADRMDTSAVTVEIQDAARPTHANSVAQDRVQAHRPRKDHRRRQRRPRLPRSRSPRRPQRRDAQRLQRSLSRPRAVQRRGRHNPSRSLRARPYLSHRGDRNRRSNNVVLYLAQQAIHAPLQSTEAAHL